MFIFIYYVGTDGEFITHQYRFPFIRKTGTPYIAIAPLSPLPLAGGVGVGSQHLYERIRAQALSRAKFNKDVKIRKADFFLNISPYGEIYHIREADISRCKATYHSRKARISLERSEPRPSGAG